MLPPVTATSSTDLPFNNMPANPLAGAAVAVSEKPSNAGSSTTAASLFARANLASLSSELQFAQNISVLADAIGKLLNLPKQDGETPGVYVQRLTSAMTALAPAQRAALEAQITKILPGLNLSILIETMKNPAGPQAARLALLLETAPHRGSDLAAKAVVSSYRQNIGAESRPQPNIAVQVQGARPAPLTTSPETTQRVPMAPAPTRPFFPVATNAAPYIGHGRAIRLDPSVTTPKAIETNALKGATIDVPLAAKSPVLPLADKVPARDGTLIAQSPRTLQAATQSSSTMPAADLAKTVQTPLAPQAQNSLTDLKPVSHIARILELRERFGAQEPANSPATTRHPVPSKSEVLQTIKDAPTQAALHPGAALIAAITSAKLPVPADGTPSLLASIFGFLKTGLTEKSTSGLATAATLDSEVDELLSQIKRLPRAEAQTKLMEGLRHLPADSPQIQALLMAALRNELTVAQPYVNYLPAEDDYEDHLHPRGQWSAGEDERESEAEDDAEAESENTEDEVEQGPDAPSDASSLSPISDLLNPSDELLAESYYLKMGAFN